MEPSDGSSVWKDWQARVSIIRPATVIGWQRKGFGPVPKEVRQLIRMRSDFRSCTCFWCWRTSAAHRASRGHDSSHGAVDGVARRKKL